MRNTNVSFQLLAITLETRVVGTNSKVKVPIICKQSVQKKLLNWCAQCAYISSTFFLLHLLTFAPGTY